MSRQRQMTYIVIFEVQNWFWVFALESFLRNKIFAYANPPSIEKTERSLRVIITQLFRFLEQHDRIRCCNNISESSSFDLGARWRTHTATLSATGTYSEPYNLSIFSL